MDPTELGRVQHHPIDADASGGADEFTLYTAPATKYARVVRFGLIASDEGSVQFKTGSRDLSGVITLAGAGSGWDRPYEPTGYFRLNPGEALILDVLDAIVVGGDLAILVDP